ncbi:MAG TPA: copper resistance protein CopC [Kineosporiaceae bacterium]|nr:copper resistance protein CopC [Kineosporiaceae bacterium]
MTTSRPDHTAHRIRQALAGLGLAALALVGTALPAEAHATLESTTPQQGGELQASPPTVELRFSEAVGIGPRAVEVLDAAGHRVDDGAPRHPAGSADAVEVGLRGSLPRGSYTVVWHVVSADSHPIAGTFSFGVEVPAGTSAASAEEDAGVTMTDAALRALAYAGAVLLVGGAFFLVVLWPAGLARRRSRRLIEVGWVASAVAAAGLFLVEGPYGAGLGLGSVLDPELLGDTLASRYGKLMLLRLLALAIAVPPLRHLLRRGRPSAVDLAALGTVFVFTFSLSEHAGQGSLVALSIPADAVHLAAACVWVGGLAVIAVALLGPAAEEDDADRVLPAWSRTAMTAVALLVVTGTFQAWRGIGSLAALTGTTYGVLVLAKVAGLVVLLVLADQGRRWVRRRTAAPVREARAPAHVGVPAGGPGSGRTPAPDGDRPPPRNSLRRLRASVLGELGVAAVVLAVTTALVNTVPGIQAYAPSYSATLTATSTDGRTLTVLVDVDSTRVGATTLHLYTYTPQGAVAPFVRAQGRLTTSGPDTAPVRFTFTPAGPGHGTAEGVVVPSVGRWSLTVDVLSDAATDYAATAGYEVR